MKIDLVFIIIICLLVVWSWRSCDSNNKPKTVEKMTDTVASNDVKEAVRQVYNADVQAIRNLSEVANKIQTDGLTVPAHANIRGRLNVGSGANAKDFPDWLSMSVDTPGDTHVRLKTKNDDGKNVYLVNRDGHFHVHAQNVGDIFGVNHDGHHYVTHKGDHIMHLQGDGNNPYMSLGKTDTWDKKKLYIQNVDAHTENPTFRVGIHGLGPLMDMSKTHGARWMRKDGRWTHFDWVDGKNYIRGDTIINDKLCIGNTCIDESHLQMLTGARGVSMKHISGSNVNQMNHPWVHFDPVRHLVKWHEDPANFVFVKN